ncbi:MAG: ROK family protein [Anaerolineaceae bacterium]|nr:ROK family protein [Anaerolineaceae bacterium]
MDTYIAVDVGGTQLRAACYPKGETKPLLQKRTSTHGKDGSPVDRLLDLIATVWPDHATVKTIGVAVPGPTNHKQGILYRAPNIPGWENLPLVQIIQSRFNTRAALGNDANMAAMGEWRFGAARGHQNVLYLTISTGIGAGVICDDRLVLGQNGLATELGHITVLPDGPVCGCGHKGHLEALASGTAIARFVAEQLAKGIPSSLSQTPNPSSRDVGMAAENGDPLALEALTRAGRYLGWAVADFLHMFNPSIVVLGGGVSQTGPLIIEPMRQAMSERVMSPEYLHGLTIATAALGDNAGLMGALALAESVSK